MKNITYTLLFLLTFMLVGCKSTPNYLTAEQLKSNYHKVMVFENSSDEIRPLYSIISQFYDPKFTRLMAKHQIEFVDSSRYFEVYEQLKAQEQDNLFDPNTGQKNSQLALKLRLIALSQVKEELQLDAFVQYGVKIRTAYFSTSGFDFDADWDGVSEPYLLDGAGAGDVLASIFIKESGSVAALSFYIEFVDQELNTLSVGRGGIELLAKYNGDKFVTKKVADVLDQAEQLATAFELAAAILNGKSQ